MGRCSMIFSLLAAAFAGLLAFGYNHPFSRGMIPILVKETKITENSIPNLNGKVILVTGANTGLGKSTAKHLAANGARVVMGCRSMEKCKQAKKTILKELKEEKKNVMESSLEPMELDLASLNQVKTFSKEFGKHHKRLDSLVLNAGVMHPPFGLTEDGIETQMGVNHFGHFYLTKLLMPFLEKAQPSTIVSVSSNGHFGSYPEGIKLNFNDMNDPKQYDKIRGYGQSKLANILFAQELGERLMNDNKKIFVNSMNPGGVNTDLLRHYPEWFQNLAKKFFEAFPNKVFFESDLAALTEVYLAVGEDIVKNNVTGKYFVPLGEISETSEDAKSMKLQKGLWDLTEDVLKQKGFIDA